MEQQLVHLTWYIAGCPEKIGHYLVTVQRENGKRFLGYSFWNGKFWSTRQKEVMLTGVVAWAYKPAYYNGPEQPEYPTVAAETVPDPLPEIQPIHRFALFGSLLNVRWTRK